MGKTRGRAWRALREEEREGGAVAQARRVEGGGGLRTAVMGRARQRQAPVERHSSRGGEGGGAPGVWAVMGPLAWASLNEQ
jgi:hypothetical protein